MSGLDRLQTMRWKSAVALVMIALSLTFNWVWVWGVLFVVWAILDLRHRVTHLLDEIPRADSPVLYWLVVLLWLVSGLWFLVVPDGGAWGATSRPEVTSGLSWSAPVVASAAPAEAPAAPAPPTQTEVPDTTWRAFTSDRFGFGGEVPADWSGSETADRDGMSLDFTSPDDAATFSIVAVDWGARTDLDEFVPYLEEEIGKEVSLVRPGRGSPVAAPPALSLPDGADVLFKRYVGEEWGYAMDIMAAFIVRGREGFVLLGVRLEGDLAKERILRQAFESFSLREG